MYNWFLGPRKAVIFLWDFLCQEKGKRNGNERGEKNGDPSIIKKEVALYSCKRCIFMNTSYGLETAPNEIKTFLQRLHNYAVVATHLVSYIGWRRRIKKKISREKKMADSIEWRRYRLQRSAKMIIRSFRAPSLIQITDEHCWIRFFYRLRFLNNVICRLNAPKERVW